MFVHNGAIAAKRYQTREPGESDISHWRQGSQVASVTKSVPLEYGETVNEGRLAQYCSLGTVLLVDSDSGTSCTRAHLLSACKVTVTPVTGYAEVSSSAQRSTYDVVVISMGAGFEQVRDTAFHVRKSWPDAKILLLGKSTLNLDDPLYDDIVDPALHPAALVRSVMQLLPPAAHRRAD